MIIIELSYRYYVVIGLVRCNKLKVFKTNTRFSFSGPMDDRLPFDTSLVGPNAEHALDRHWWRAYSEV